jgi:DNA-binding PadR family transcriptional regulator
MLELATLGLLQREPLHGYRLKQQLELFMSGCISVNYGAIYPLLQRLEKQGAIRAVVEKNRSNGSARKIYSVTEAGKAIWKQEMLANPHESWVHARSRFMIKFFFFSHLEPAERLSLLEHRLMVCRLRLEAQTRQLLPDDPYQIAAWQRASEVLHEEIQWLEQQVHREKWAYEDTRLPAEVREQQEE